MAGFVQGSKSAINDISVSTSLSGVVVGNVIVVSTICGNTNPITSLTDNLGNTYTAVDSLNLGSTYPVQTWYSVVTHAGNPIITAANSTNPQTKAIVAQEYSGLATTPFDKNTHATGTGTSPSSGNTATLTQADELVVGIISWASSDTLSLGSGYSSLTATTSGSGYRTGLESKQVSATTAVAATGTISSSPSSGWYAGVMTFKVAVNTINVTKSAQYKVASPKDITKSAAYKVANPHDITKTAQYGVVRPISELVDFFDDNSLDTGLWTDFGGTGAETNYEYEVTLTGTPNYSGLIAVKAYSLVNSVISIKLVNQPLTTYTSLEVTLSVEKDNNNKLFFNLSAYGGVLNLDTFKTVGGVQTNLNSVPYVHANMQFWRIRESGGTVYFDYSGDRLTWTNHSSVANPFSLIALTPSFFAGNYNTEAGGQIIAFDEVNANYATITKTLAGQYVVPYDRTVTKSAQYKVPHNTDITKSSGYLVATPHTITKTAGYVVLSFETITKTAKYHVSPHSQMDGDSSVVAALSQHTYNTVQTFGGTGSLTSNGSLVFARHANVGGDADLSGGEALVEYERIQKSFMYKVFNSSGDYLTTWDKEVNSSFEIAEQINGSGSEVVIKLARTADDYGEGFDVNYRNRVEVYVIDKEQPNGFLRFTGFISKYEPDYNSEEISITVLGYGADMKDYVMEDTGDTTIAHLSEDPSDIARAVLDDFSGRGGVITYDGSSIDDTSTTVSYTFNTNTVKEGVDKSLELAPEDWYYFIDQATNLFHFHLLSSTPVHTFAIGRDIKNLKIQKNIEGVVNVVYFSGGDTGSGILYKKYTNPTSIALYGEHAFRYKDGRVTLVATADLLAGKTMQSSPQILVDVEIIDSNLNDLGYDIETIKLGDTVKIGSSGTGPSSLYDLGIFDTSPFDYDLENLSSIVFQITNLKYTGDTMQLSLSTTPPDITKRIQDIQRNVVDLQNNDNPTAPS